MNPEMAPESEAFYRSVSAAIDAAGGFELVGRAELDWTAHTEAAKLLAGVGVWDIDARGSSDDLEAAAVACRAAGRCALPYPVAERLAAGDGTAVAVISGPLPRVSMGQADLRWTVLDAMGSHAAVTSMAPAIGSKLATFTSAVTHGEWVAGDDRAALCLVLQAWTLLGMVERAAEQTYGYVGQRHQFGQALSSFQSVQFRLTDVAMSVSALEEIAKHALWSVGKNAPATALVDAVALRLASLETADLVFRAAHQLYGALGFCDETNLSWLSRHSQPLRRLPWGTSRTEEKLLGLIASQPFSSIYPAGYAIDGAIEDSPLASDVSLSEGSKP